MSLPPDPHDDDLADRSSVPPAPIPPPPANATAAAAAGATGTTETGTTTDATDTTATTGTGTTTDATDTTATTAVRAPAPAAPRAPRAAPGAAHPVDPAGIGGAPSPASGRRRVGLLVGGLVAAVVLVGGAAVALGSGDGGDDDSPAGETAAGDATDDGARGADDGATPGSASDAPASDASPGSGDAPASGDSPVEVAEDFFDAAERADCVGVVTRMTPQSYGSEGQSADEAIAECEADEAFGATMATVEFDDIELVSETGDRATVVVTMIDGVSETESEIPLRRVDGEWKLHLDPSLAPATG